MNNDDLFLYSNTYEPEGTLEDRWGPRGFMICGTCKKHWYCNWNAYYSFGPKVCKVCKNNYTWIEYNTFQRLNKDDFN